MKKTLEKQSKLLKELAGKIPELAKENNLAQDFRGEIYLLGAGKASLTMARELVDTGCRIKDGIIISGTTNGSENGFQVFEGAHPYPDNKTVAASYELLRLAQSIPEGSEVVFCLSGGASSMLTIPPYGVEVEELQSLYRLLLHSGASIHEMNVVRKHVCELKGGKLSEVLARTRLVTLISSDVPGDDPEIIGSGPTVPDSSTFGDAMKILHKYDLWNELPASIQDHIIFGIDGIVPENPKPDMQNYPNHQVRIISRSAGLAENIASRLRKKGYTSWVAPSAYNDTSRKVAKEICSKAVSVLSGNNELKKPAALIFHGESTIHVSGKGKGGRNQELALMAALSIEGQHPISILSIGTDGIDGPTDAAGALVNSQTALAARKKKLDPEKYLQDNDSYHFHEEMDTLIKTGPTGVNLMDLQVVLVD